MKTLLLASALALCCLSPAARAGQAADRLSTCLTTSATPADRTALVQWIFGAVSVHPDLKGLVTVDAGRRATLDDVAGRVFERLIAEDCTAPAREAFLQEGMDGYKSAFEALGKLAMTDFVSQKDVQKSMQSIGDHIDRQRVIKALLSK